MLSTNLGTSAQAGPSTTAQKDKPKTTDWKPDTGFEKLFNGNTLQGWCYRNKEGEITEKFNRKKVSSDGRYTAANGILTVNYPVGVERKIQESWTLREFPGNFILKIEFRASPNADSGIFLRGLQLQCRDYTVAGPYKDLKNYRPQDWNTIVVTVKNNIAHCECNGEVLEDALELPASGSIGLEGDHGQMEYRHIQIKELP
ncbi:DUF1080 domain-containing protein [Pedobacter sp. V48]|uniref:3-keto-disaccharide hydrolase n=1 Tax=Pedobacter sp. V48 TaxID=509635 RepID=UPI00190F6802|nr:DUF1080 domain-containing protein [Pedobacter sp. V48]